METQNKFESAGFTLIELLVVIAIIALLASIVLVALNSAREKSRESRRVADVTQIATALELYYNDYGGYPSQTGLGELANADTGISSLGGNNHSLSALENTGNQNTEVYMASVPVAPQPADSTTCSSPNVIAGVTSAGDDANSYMYFGGATAAGLNDGTSGQVVIGGLSTPVATSYQLFFCLGNVSGGYSAGIHVESPSGVQ